MASPRRLVNWVIKGLSLVVGGASFYVLFYELSGERTGLNPSVSGYYIIFASDLIMSLTGSAMLAYLFHYLVWDCCKALGKSVDKYLRDGVKK